jgi:hypothetical protein
VSDRMGSEKVEGARGVFGCLGDASGGITSPRGKELVPS